MSKPSAVNPPRLVLPRRYRDEILSEDNGFVSFLRRFGLL